jgi:hypothetical protein
METLNEILTELQEIAPALGREKYLLPYRVPTGYFHGFSDELMNLVRKTAAIPESDVFTEINEISPLLAGLKNRNPYQVPAGFFEALKTTIPQQETIPATVTEMPVRKTSVFARNIRRFAVAASVIAILGITCYQFGFLHRTIQTDPLSALAAVSEQDMANYLDSDDIHWTPAISSPTALADFSESDIHDLLSSVSDSELEQYLPISDEKGTVN